MTRLPRQRDLDHVASQASRRWDQSFRGLRENAKPQQPFPQSGFSRPGLAPGSPGGGRRNHQYQANALTAAELSMTPCRISSRPSGSSRAGMIK